MAQTLRAFRKAFSTLKKQGLIKSRVPANKIFPDKKIGRFHASTLVRKYDDVVSGKVTAVKVSPTKVKAFRKAGYETAKGRVLVPHGLDEKVIARSGEISVKHKSGMQRVQLPVEYHNLEQWARDIEKNQDLINAMKARNEYWGFRFSNEWGGGHSSEIHQSIGHLIEQIRKYEDFQRYAGRPRKGADFYRNIEIIKIERSSAWKFPSERRHENTKKANRRHAKKWRKRHADDPEYKRRHAEQEQARRDGMSAAEKLKYRKKAKARAKKSRKKTRR